ncbi:MAG TPA: hypothetical protein VMU17_01220, partial [Elusimicrobiota bacterium]|nr:hypothetical protein [Elusimicrobiota bacterium]
GDLPGNDLLGSGNMQFGSVHVAVNDPNLGSPGYVLISTTPRTFWVTASIDQSAVANHVFALDALTKDAFTIGALVAGDGIHSVDPVDFPMQTGASVIGATVDTMTVTFTDILPNSIQEAQNNVPVGKLNVKASANTVIWNSLIVKRTGANPDDSDITHINVWKDINDNGIFDDGNTVPVTHLSATLNPTDNSFQVDSSTSFPTGPAVVYVGSELIKYASNDGINTFSGLTHGFMGTAAAVHAQASTVYGVVNDTLVDNNLVHPGLITSGTNNFSNGISTLTFVTSQVVPNVADKFTGVNYFLTYDINPFAPVYRDTNNNGVQDTGETVTIGGLIDGATSFAVVAPKVVALTNIPPLTTKNSGLTEYPDAVLFTPDDSLTPVSATQGDTDVPVLKFSLKTPVSYARLTSLKVARIGQGAIQTQGSNDDIALVKLYRDANFDGILEPDVDVLLGTGTFTSPDPNGTNAKNTTITLFKTETLNPTGQTYFLAYDIATGATSNNSEGVSIQDPGWFNGSFVPAGVDYVRADNLPHNSRQISISPLLLKITGNSLAPTSVLQGQTGVPLLAITITPSINQVVISSITLSQTGTIQNSTGTPGAVPGDGDFSRLYVYLDKNFNGLIDADDPLIGSLPWGLTGGHFQGGTASIPFSSPVTFNTSGGTFLIAGDIGMVDGTGLSTQGHTAGIALAGPGALSLSPSTALQDPSNQYPVGSANIPIYNVETVQISTISMRPDLTTGTVSGLENMYFPHAFIDRQDQIAATWLTNPPEPLPSNIDISYQIGVSASSDTTLPPTLTGWIVTNSAPPVTINGLGLANGQTYYFFVRTITKFSGITLPPSPIVVGSVQVDVSKPTPPGEFLNMPTSAPSGVITVQWPHSSSTGPSGLFGYKLRQFTDGSPVPVELVLTSTPSFTFGASLNAASMRSMAIEAGTLGAATQPAPLVLLNGETGAARAPGHFYSYQIQTINGAGTASAWSPMSSIVNTGLPSEIITQVSNYPNPVDTRKGGIEGRTFITYILASDADVEITVYDLLGYRVMHWTFQGGGAGGLQGPNTVPPGGWDGTNEAGQKVSKGGYLAQIKASGGAGSSTVIRKIGVIH